MGGTTWIDDEGRLRLNHDENYQMVISGGTDSDDVALKMDSWGIERACKMIVLGYNLDIKRTIEYGLKHCPHGTNGNDRANALITIMDRVLTLAKSAIAGGVIKEHDTPANWIKWAQSKGYKTDHLNPSIQIKAFQDSIHKSENAGCIESYREQLEQWQSPNLTVSIAPQQQTEAASDSATEQASTRPIQANSNEFAFSGLLNIPLKKDGWFRVIDDMTRVFHKQKGKIPNEAQAWAQLWTPPPEGYEITTGTYRGEDCLNMPAEKKPLSISMFTDRWKKYTAQKTE
jgi:hypothetical protein